MVPRIAMFNNSINDQLFVYTQSNDQIVLFQIIQFSMSTKLNVCKQMNDV